MYEPDGPAVICEHNCTTADAYDNRHGGMQAAAITIFIAATAVAIAIAGSRR
jgi:hypothetical protein